MSKQILQLKIKLMGSSKPPIWREVQVPNDFSFHDLNLVILAAMGWGGGHLYQFEPKGADFYIGMPDDFGMDTEDARKIKISKLLKAKGDKLVHEYDFGDGWKHSIDVQKVLEPSPGTKYPLLLKGKGQCPPDDCGGIWGYYHLVDAINDPKHEEHEDMTEWLGVKSWDVNDFDLASRQEAVRNWKGRDFFSGMM